MSSRHDSPIPTELKLNRKQTVLEISFDDGSHFILPCEYLRVYSPAAEAKVARVSGEWITGKKSVNIEHITPVGNYAVQIVFDDNHDTGIYSWQTLYDLGKDQERNWARHIEQTRETTIADSVAPELQDISILYFSTLVTQLGLESEKISISKHVNTVSRLLAWLRNRGGIWSEKLDEAQVTVTVNKQFAEPGTSFKPGAEISITPSYPSVDLR